MATQTPFNHLKTVDGANIVSYETVEKLRSQYGGKSNSPYFIAQAGAQELGLGSEPDIMVFGGNRGGGKANTYNTPIATPSGFRKMGDLEVGDLICTPYNGVQKVSAIFEQGVQRVYNFHFDDGTTVSCMDNHRFWARVGSNGPFCEMTAREIMDNYVINNPYPLSLRRDNTEFVQIPLCGEVELNETKTIVDLPIHPFILGFACSTGFWHFGRIGLCVNDDFYIKRHFSALGYLVRKHHKDGLSYLRGISDECRRRISCSRRREPAHIPQEYKTASIQARWELLRGIMYTNGRSQRCIPYLDLPNKKLIQDVAEVARSLGIWARVSQVEDVPERMGYWRVTLLAPDNKRLFVKE